MIRELTFISLLSAIAVACGDTPTSNFYASEVDVSGAEEQNAASDDVLADNSNGNADGTGQWSTREFQGNRKINKAPENKNKNSLASNGNTSAADDNAPTVEEVLATCKNAEILKVTHSLEFPAHTQTCEWGTKVVENGITKEVLSPIWQNLPIKNGWIRAIDEQHKEVPLPENAIVCGVNLKSKTNSIHFDDYFNIRANDYIIAGSKVITNALTADEAGIYSWNWIQVRGDGSQETGTRMVNQGKYFLSEVGELPPHDQPGPFDLQMSFSEDFNEEDPVQLRLATLFSRLTGQKNLKITMSATGDDDGGDCFHSGGNFDLEIAYVKEGTVPASGE